MPTTFVLAVTDNSTLDPLILGETFTDTIIKKVSSDVTQGAFGNINQGISNYNNGQKQIVENGSSGSDGLATNCAEKLGDSKHGPGCNLSSDLKPMVKNVLKVVVTLVVFVTIFVLGWTIIRIMFLREEQRSSELKEAKEKFLYVVLGFILITAVVGGVIVAILQTIGVKSDFIDPINNFFSYSFIDTAYAVTDTNLLLPNPTNVNNLYDFLLVMFQAVVRWFLFPAIIFAWFYAGASFVYAKGSPEKLKEARKNLLYVFAGTVIIMMLQGMLIALQETIRNIFAK